MAVTGINTASFWFSEEERRRLVESGDVEQEIRLEFIDVASLHTYTSENS